MSTRLFRVALAALILGASAASVASGDTPIQDAPAQQSAPPAVAPVYVSILKDGENAADKPEARAQQGPSDEQLLLGQVRATAATLRHMGILTANAALLLMASTLAGAAIACLAALARGYADRRRRRKTLAMLAD